MFERFTEGARQVVVLAQEEARALGHAHIGTEHILLVLLREGEGVGAVVLSSLGLTVTAARERVARLVPSQEPSGRSGQIPFTPRAKKVLEMALRESLSFGHNYIGTEHILLGLVKVTDGIAVTVLRESGIEPGDVTERVISMLAEPPARSQAARGATGACASTAGSAAVLPGDVLAFLMEIGREISEQLGREPDVADYMVALASVPDSLVERVLRELGIDAAAAAEAIERARAQVRSPLGALTPDQAARHARMILGLSSPE